jgi:hypothetical protein
VDGGGAGAIASAATQNTAQALDTTLTRVTGAVTGMDLNPVFTSSTRLLRQMGSSLSLPAQAFPSYTVGPSIQKAPSTLPSLVSKTTTRL